MSEREIPFFPPDMFEDDRMSILEVVHEVGMDEPQKFILGKRVAALEDRVRELTGAAHAVACGSGTGALDLSVRALGIGPGDEVIVPAFCCQPVASSVIDAGATPVFADIDEATMVIDPGSVDAQVGERTAAIMPAHVFSVMADMPALRNVADAHHLPLIEDAAIAQGASFDGRPAGRWGDIGAWSFFQVKALGAIGEGGMILTDDNHLAARCRSLRNHGQDGPTRGVHQLLGQNSRMDEILAGFLLLRYERLDERLDRRAEIARYYTGRFAELREHGVLAPPVGSDGRCYYVYSLLTDRREELRAELAEQGIGTHVYYPLALPRQPAFRGFSQERAWPRAEAAGRRNLALPIFPHLHGHEVERIADAVVNFFTRSADPSMMEGARA